MIRGLVAQRAGAAIERCASAGGYNHSVQPRWYLALIALALTLLAPLVARAPEGAGGATRFLVKTDAGAFTIELDEAGHPQSAEEFRKRLAFGWYDGAIFARRRGDCLIQLGNQTLGGAAPDCSFSPELPEPLSGGYLAWAMASDDRQAGYPFFISLISEDLWDAGIAGSPPAAPRFTPFAKVTQGLDIVRQLRPGDAIKDITAQDVEE